MKTKILILTFCISIPIARVMDYIRIIRFHGQTPPLYDFIIAIIVGVCILYASKKISEKILQN